MWFIMWCILGKSIRQKHNKYFAFVTLINSRESAVSFSYKLSSSVFAACVFVPSVDRKKRKSRLVERGKGQTGFLWFALTSWSTSQRTNAIAVPHRSTFYWSIVYLCALEVFAKAVTLSKHAAYFVEVRNEDKNSLSSISFFDSLRKIKDSRFKVVTYDIITVCYLSINGDKNINNVQLTAVFSKIISIPAI